MDEEQKKLVEELLFSEKKKPSFAKELFKGKFLADNVIPFPKIFFGDSKEIEEFIQKISQFADREIDAYEIDKQEKIPDRVIKGLAEMGVLGMTLPKEMGGQGFSQYAFCRVLEELSARCGSTALFVNVHQSIGLRALLLFGTEEQKKNWLPKLASGKTISAFCLTEENAGSDASGVETTAVFDPEKNVYRINGSKRWITNGSIAGFLTVMAKVDGKITAFIVTPDMPGFNIDTANLEKLGMRGTVTSVLKFKDMEVPEEFVLGFVGGGLKVALTVLDYGRSAFGATCTGAAIELVKRATDHAIKRHQFKRPLASFYLVKEKIAKMRALAFAMQSATYLTAGFIDSKREDFMLEAAMLKVFASDALWQIIYDAMQILGGSSFFTDEPYERMMRDSRLNMIGEGSNEVLCAFIAAVGLKGKGDQFKKPLNVFKILRSFFSAKINIKNPGLKKEVKALGKAIGKFSRAAAKLIIKYREGIVEEQLHLNRLTSMAISIFTQTAVISRLENKNAQDVDFSAGKFYCKMAMDDFMRHYKSISKNFDRDIFDLSYQITGI